MLTHNNHIFTWSERWLLICGESHTLGQGFNTCCWKSCGISDYQIPQCCTISQPELVCANTWCCLQGAVVLRFCKSPKNGVLPLGLQTVGTRKWHWCWGQSVSLEHAISPLLLPVVQQYRQRNNSALCNVSSVHILLNYDGSLQLKRDLFPCSLNQVIFFSLSSQIRE